MTRDSIFPVLSIDRDKIHWEDYLHRLTPIDSFENVRVKREDCFAPLGMGGINGGKVRQLLWVFGKYIAELKGQSGGVLMAGSVRSPLLARVPVVARHLGLPCHLVIASDPELSSTKNESVKIARRMQATFSRCPVGYNPALQRMAARLHEKEEFRRHYLMEYGLSIGGANERVEEFYRFASEQTQNIPEDIETLLLPAGSCNTLLAVIYGLAVRRPARLRDVILFGIGPNRIAWFEERIKTLESVSGVQIGNLFRRDYKHNRPLQEQFNVSAATAPYRLAHYDLHTTGFAGWGDEMPASIGGLRLHPLYEGKIWNYMQKNSDEFGGVLRSEHVLLWTVGGEASCAAMEPHLGGSL